MFDSVFPGSWPHPSLYVFLWKRNFLYLFLPCIVPTKTISEILKPFSSKRRLHSVADLGEGTSLLSFGKTPPPPPLPLKIIGYTLYWYPCYVFLRVLWFRAQYISLRRKQNNKTVELRFKLYSLESKWQWQCRAQPRSQGAFPFPFRSSYLFVTLR